LRAFTPKVALAPNGDAVAVWEEQRETPTPGFLATVVMAAVGHAGTCEPPTQLSAGYAGGATITMAESGEAIAAWNESTAAAPDVVGVMAAIRPPRGSFGPPATLGPIASVVGHGPQLASDARGDAVAVWFAPAGENRGVARVARRLAGTNVWKPLPKGLPAVTSGYLAYNRVRVAVAPRGGMVLAWSVIARNAYGVVRALVMPVTGRVSRKSIQTVVSAPIIGADVAPSIDAIAMAHGKAIVGVGRLKNRANINLFARPT